MLSIVRKASGFLAVLGIVCVFSLSSMAQTFRGGISGTVTDSSGGAVPNTVVTATADATGLVHTTTASGAGEYGFQDLQLGTYTVVAKGGGFKALEVKGVQVNAGVILALPLQAFALFGINDG